MFVSLLVFYLFLVCFVSFLFLLWFALFNYLFVCLFVLLLRPISLVSDLSGNLSLAGQVSNYRRPLSILWLIDFTSCWGFAINADGRSESMLYGWNHWVPTSPVLTIRPPGAINRWCLLPAPYQNFICPFFMIANMEQNVVIHSTYCTYVFRLPCRYFWNAIIVLRNNRYWFFPMK